MTNGTVRPQPSARGSGMTLRVYAVDCYGTVTRDRGTVTVVRDTESLPEMLSTRFPPCACARHRAERAVRP